MCVNVSQSEVRKLWTCSSAFFVVIVVCCARTVWFSCCHFPLTAVIIVVKVASVFFCYLHVHVWGDTGAHCDQRNPLASRKCTWSNFQHHQQHWHTIGRMCRNYVESKTQAWIRIVFYHPTVYNALSWWAMLMCNWQKCMLLSVKFQIKTAEQENIRLYWSSVIVVNDKTWTKWESLRWAQNCFPIDYSNTSRNFF